MNKKRRHLLTAPKKVFQLASGSSSSYYIAKDGGSVYPIVISTQDITVSSNKTWLSVSFTNNGNNKLLTITATSNDSGTSTRNGTITVRNQDNDTITITIYEYSSSWSFYTSDSSFNVSDASGTQYVTVTSTKNGSWQGLSEYVHDNWITLNYYSGTSTTNTYSLDYAANPGETARTGYVEFTQNTSGYSEKVYIYQAGPVYEFSLYSGNTSYSLDPQSGSQSISITSTRDGIGWEFTASSNANWITCTIPNSFSGSQGGNSVTIQYTENLTSETRIGSVTLTQNTSGNTILITITQSGYNPSFTSILYNDNTYDIYRYYTGEYPIVDEGYNYTMTMPACPLYSYNRDTDNKIFVSSYDGIGNSLDWTVTTDSNFDNNYRYTKYYSSDGDTISEDTYYSYWYTSNYVLIEALNYNYSSSETNYGTITFTQNKLGYSFSITISQEPNVEFILLPTYNIFSTVLDYNETVSGYNQVTYDTDTYNADSKHLYWQDINYGVRNIINQSGDSIIPIELISSNTRYYENTIDLTGIQGLSDYYTRDSFLLNHEYLNDRVDNGLNVYKISSVTRSVEKIGEMSGIEIFRPVDTKSVQNEEDEYRHTNHYYSDMLINDNSSLDSNKLLTVLNSSVNVGDKVLLTVPTANDYLNYFSNGNKSISWWTPYSTTTIRMYDSSGNLLESERIQAYQGAESSKFRKTNGFIRVIQVPYYIDNNGNKHYAKRDRELDLPNIYADSIFSV